MRVRFNELFRVSEDGITPRVPIQIGVYVLTPDSRKCNPVDLHRYVGMDVNVATDQITQRYVILGFYTDDATHKPPVDYPGKSRFGISVPVASQPLNWLRNHVFTGFLGL